MNKGLFLGVWVYIVLGLTPSSWAEYRVYRLGIKASERSSETQVLTTLDDQQYLAYYRVTANQEVRLIAHWMCRGRTDGFKKYCPQPPRPSQAKALNQAPLEPAVQQPVPNVLQ